MKKNNGWETLGKVIGIIIVVGTIVLSMWLTKTIIESGLPLWAKYFLLY